LILIVLSKTAAKARNPLADLARKEQQSTGDYGQKPGKGLKQDSACIWINVHFYS
jgi:hypothetical protein